MRSRTIFAVTAFLFLGSSPAVPAGRPTTAPIQDEDIFALEYASDVQISPNGRFVAYVRSRPNEQNDTIGRSIWLVDLATKEQRMLIKEKAEHPRWSPDSSRIAYLADDSESRTQLFVIDTAGGATPKALTKGADAPADAVWAPDGTQLIMTQQVSTASNDFPIATPAKPPGSVWAPRPHVVTSAFYSQDSVGFLGPTHSGLAVVPAIGGEVRKVPIGDLDVTGALTWTPDGMSLLFAAKPLSTAGQSVTGFPLSSLYELRRSDGSLRRLSRDDEAVTSAEVSRDGRYVAFVRHNGKAMIWQDELWVLDRKDGRSRRQQPSLDRAVATVHWTKDDRLLFSYGDAGESVVAIAAIDGPETIATRHADGGDFSAADDGSIGFALGSAERPTEAGVVRSGSGDLAAAPLNRELLHDRAVGRVVTLRVLSSFDNETVPSFAILPPGYSPRRRYPTILWIHGGLGATRVLNGMPTSSSWPQRATSCSMPTLAGRRHTAQDTPRSCPTLLRSKTMTT